MTKTMQQPVSTANRELVFSRLINAPQELVFKVWTEPEHVAQCWGRDRTRNGKSSKWYETGLDETAGATA